VDKGRAQLDCYRALVGRTTLQWGVAARGTIRLVVTLKLEAPCAKNTHWMVTLMLNPKFGIEKSQLTELMDHRNIHCRPSLHPLSSLPPYGNLEQARQARQRNCVSYEISPYGINLPSGLNMTEEKVKYVCKVLKSILQR
jgi:perosamine synthetase